MIGIKSTEFRENFTREKIENIVVSLSQQHSVSGYDVIKIVFQRFNVLLSPGTVYPLLYSLEEKGVLNSEVKGSRRMKLYTSAGKSI
ncbi:MAG: PadR family transcriptional regulator [Candidatus Thermoplasmatota archaeon]|nr:PadR family transcriptional regulator [Candidatus Thermoplasmatota archaeon]